MTTVQPRFALGVDLGQAHDFSAFAAVERMAVPTEEGMPGGIPERGGRVAAQYNVVGLDRMRGASYVEVCDRIAELYNHPDLSTLPSARPSGRRPNWPAAPPLVAVDYTGVGRPVADLLSTYNIPHKKVTITEQGEPATTKIGLSVSRFDLIMHLSAAFSNGWIWISDELELRGVLTNELANLKPRVTPTGRESIGHWRESEHDDLVFALALALWVFSKKRRRRMLYGHYGRRGPL